MILEGMVEEVKEVPKPSSSPLTLEEATNIAKTKLERALNANEINNGLPLKYTIPR